MTEKNESFGVPAQASGGVSRRVLLQGPLATYAGFGISRALAAGQEATQIHNFLLFKKRPTQTLGEFMRWYEELHAPAFVTVAGKHVSRYSRNFVMGYRGQDPGFDAIVEFGYPSEKAAAEAGRLSSTPEAAPLIGARLRVVGDVPASEGKAAGGNQPPPGQPTAWPNLITISEKLLAGPPRDHNPAPTWKATLVLQRKGNTSPESFAVAAEDFGKALARKIGDSAERVVLDLNASPTNVPRQAADAYLTVWPKKGIMLPPSYNTPSALEVVSVLDIEGHESVVGG